MNLSKLINARLNAQQIAGTKYESPAHLVDWMGAMQAQDDIMAKWAIGVRLTNITEQDVVDSLDKAHILRTHVLRPTWHYVAPADIRWMLALTTPNIKVSARSRHKQLELTEGLFRKTNRIIEKLLRDGNHLTREEIMLHLEKVKIHTGTERGLHIMFMAELEGIVCSGKTRNKRHTYALLEERVPQAKKLSRDESLAKLAQKYFMSHGPATLQDFVWWSGLPVKNARIALNSIEHTLVNEQIGSRFYWFDDKVFQSKISNRSAHTLPPFDEFLISYKDRSAMLPEIKNKLAISGNGIFKPVIIINGKVAGLWSRTFLKGNAIITIDFFEQRSKSDRQRVITSFKRFGSFLNKPVEISFIKDR